MTFSWYTMFSLVTKIGTIVYDMLVTTAPPEVKEDIIEEIKSIQKSYKKLEIQNKKEWEELRGG